ncbi:unnamed protein product [Hymenolepis diminuta]|uniref:Type I restriction endonuclease subunit R n=1 Tax=Hymenolepis diminuta TaxID=6216 RepID=A0A0R3SQY3_HYMDI|nr:unnamed protein product [Hymenolepis diminuta]
MEQINLFKPDKEPEDNVKNVDFSARINSLLEDNHHPLRVADKLFTILNREKFFAKTVPSDVLLQVEVAAESRELLMIDT